MLNLEKGDFSSFGDTIKGKTFRRDAEDRLKVTEKLISDPEMWTGGSNVNHRLVDDPEIWISSEVSEELQSAIYPRIGRKLHPEVIEDQIDLQAYGADSLEDLVFETYSAIIEVDPSSAEDFRNAVHVDFDGQKAVKHRLDSLLSEYDGLGLSEDQAVKQALALVNQTEYEFDGGELSADYGFNFVPNRSLEQQLSDEVSSRLEGEAKVFFDYARKEESPEGVHINSGINAQSADNYEPVAELNDRARELKEEFTSEFNPTEVIEDQEDFYDAMNVEKLVERAGLGHRFDMEDSDLYQEEAQGYINAWINRIASMQEENIDYADNAVNMLESADNYHGPDRQQIEQGGLNEKVDAIMTHVDYLREQSDELESARTMTEERREPEERNSGVLSNLLN